MLFQSLRFFGNIVFVTMTKLASHVISFTTLNQLLNYFAEVLEPF